MQQAVVDIAAQDEQNGVRFSWNVWPSTRLEATRIVAPLGCMYSPLKRIEGMPPALPYNPITCSGCGAVLNPYCQIDFRTKLWNCAFCMTRNHFPAYYAENITEQNLPAELVPRFSTVEYELQSGDAGPPLFLLVIDTCASVDDELDNLKDSVQQSLNLLPQDALVGLITFGTNVQVHDLSFADCPRSVVFRGTQEYATSKVQQLLGIVGSANAPQGGGAQAAGQAAGGQSGRVPAIGKYLVSVEECSFTLESILSDLARDPWPVPSDKRHARCTGAALSVAVGLMETSAPQRGARIMAFISGPATSGPGVIVSQDKSENIRSHVDLTKNQAKYHKAATAFYTGLADRCVAANHVIDLFACSLDQVGMLEMGVCCKKTGGSVVLCDSFGQSVFKESFRRVFRRHDEGVQGEGGHMQMGFAGQIQIYTSREIKISGAIGPCSSLKRPAPNVAEVEVGEGGTSVWSMGGLDPSTTIAFYFEVAASQTQALPAHKRRMIQFMTQYQHSSGRYRLRVTTVCGLWHSDPNDLTMVARSFDQECAAVLMARLAVHRAETEEQSDILRWLDRSLIRLGAKFASYRKDEPSSFRLTPEFSIFPQFMFHLRRSQFLQLFNSSPDESTYYKSVLVKENVVHSLVMIQPSLLCYSFNGPPQPVLLDAASVRPDCILLLDTFFHVVVFHGETVAAWRAQGYQDQEEHVNFRSLLAAPQADAQLIMDARFPVPRYIVCDQHKSEARFLMAKLNPSITHNSTNPSAGQAVFTDDVSLRVFMEHLMKLAVQS
mmetsp:Transcript_22037/g.67657  ORF Transcript_22037/g.67657 Transcript_22037/m.67657 type:complete len:777 (-) Transcript_22037:16-2346(-)